MEVIILASIAVHNEDLVDERKLFNQKITGREKMNIVMENIVGIWLMPVTIFIALPLAMLLVYGFIKSLQIIIWRQQLKSARASKEEQEQVVELSNTLQL